MMLDSLFWVGHASFYIKGESTVFIDPFELPATLKEKADLVLVTHAHFDHCSKKDIDRVSTDRTIVIASSGCDVGRDAETARPGFRKKVGGIGIEAVPAYNNRKERLGFHPKSNGWVGYKVTVGGETLYHAGDTDHIAEMEGMRPDVALLPMGGTYTMDVDEAVSAANAIGARATVPMHYKHLLGKEGSAEAERRFKSGVKGALVMNEISAPSYSGF